MSIILYGTNSLALTSNQPTDIYLEDYTNNTITKQVLLDMLLKEIYDERDGNILRHINNVDVYITMKNDNNLLDEINMEGYYDIRMSCSDNDNNIGTIFWKNMNETLGQDYLTIVIKENRPPIVAINDERVFYLTDFQPSYIIDRTNLKAILIQNIIDDRDGQLDCDITDIHIFQTAIEGTSFLPMYGTNNIYLDMIDPKELLYIDEVGQYKMIMNIKDSDNANTNVDFDFNVF